MSLSVSIIEPISLAFLRKTIEYWSLPHCLAHTDAAYFIFLPFGISYLYTIKNELIVDDPFDQT